MAEDTSLQSQFFQESLDILSNAEEIVLHLEQHGFDQEQVHSLFRLFHTLKGNSNMVGEEEINSLTHALESELDQLRTGKRELDETLLQLTFEVIDTLNAVCQEGDSGDYVAQMQDLSQQLHAIGSGNSKSKTKASAKTSAETGIEPSAETGMAGKAENTTARATRSGRVPASQPDIQIGFSEWKPILQSFYKCEALAEKLKGTKEDLPEILMDLGMEAIDLRSSVEEMDESTSQSTSEGLVRLAIYIEKFTATLAREQFPYNDISYELLFVLCEDFKRNMWEQLYFTGALAYKKIATMEELHRIEHAIKPEDKLWTIDLAFASANSVRSNDFFSRMAEIKAKVDVPLVFISPHSQYYQKAADLLDQALGGFTRIAGTLEDGVKMYILSEE